jgi:hypothetical protein
MKGEIYIGRAEDNTPVFLKLKDMLKGILISGQTGAGKTSLLYLIAIQLIQHGVNVWWLDSIKNDGRFLAQLFPNIMLYFRLNENFKFNPFQHTTGRSYDEIVVSVVEQFCRDFGLLLGSETYLTQKANETIERFRRLGIEQPITVHDIHNTIINDHLRTSRMLNYRDARTLDCYQGFDVSQLGKSSLNLSMIGAPADVQTFMAGNQIGSQVFTRRALNQLTNDLQLMIIFDEANRLFPKNRELNPAESLPTLSFVSQISREYGVGLCGSTQTPSFMADSGLKSQSFIKIIIGSLGSNDDYFDMGNVMGMDRDQIEWLKTHSKVGRAVVKLSGGEFTDPFIVQVPFINLKGIAQ